MSMSIHARHGDHGDLGRAVTILALTGTSLGALAVAGYGLLVAEAEVARRIIGQPFGDYAPDADGLYGDALDPCPINLAVFGDSAAAGLGCDTPDQIPGALLAQGLAEASGRLVRLTTFATVGAESAELVDQLDQLEISMAEIGPPQVALIVIGGNDISQQVRLPAAVAHLARTVAALRELGTEVVVGTCPDLGTIKPVAQPLRALARRMSHALASSQTVAAVSAGARTVSLGDLLGPAFDAAPEELFSRDRFHPSAAGYARLAEAMLPSICVAAGYPLPLDESSIGRESVSPVTTAAAIAVVDAGTEVAPTSVNGLGNGPKGRWATRRTFRTRSWQDGLRRNAHDEVGRAG